jgi:tripartite-type tricarboxylate transporter receptor subunit TctC
MKNGPRVRRGAGLAVAALAAACALPASAQEYPTRPVRLVIGFPPGGAADVIARAVGNKLSASFGQQVIADNRGGHSGTIAAEIVSKAAPDGYTILHGTIALVVNAILTKNLPFDYTKDLLPVTQAVDQTNILVVHPSVPAKSVKELIALAKTKPLNGGSSGVGGTGHLALELFNLQAGTKITHIPYKGGGPAIVDLIGGQIQLSFATAASVVAHIQSGKLRALAVTTAKRSALVPELPTIAETGLKGYEVNNWNGFFVPAGTPRALVNRLNRDLTAVLTAPDVKDFLFKQGIETAPGTPEQFAKYMKSEHAKWSKVIQAAGLKSN